MMQFPFGFWKPSSSADLLSGADGVLSLNATSINIAAGSIKRYSSISLINAASINITGFPTHGASNPGYAPTLIGCSGNCTIDASSSINAAQINAGESDDYNADTTYSAATVPFDAAINPISYDRFGGYGGNGGETGGWGYTFGYDIGVGPDVLPTGHGGGGSGYADGGNTTSDQLWGTSGYGAESTAAGQTSYVYPTSVGFGASGSDGAGGEVGGGISVGGGGSGGLRGLSGGAVFLQIAGTASITGTIDISGQSGGNGGAGGVASSPDNGAYGGGGGGGGAGGSGGYAWIYYKSGSVAASILINGGGGGGSGGGGLADGPAPVEGFTGTYGTDGLDGGSTVATY